MTTTKFKIGERVEIGTTRRNGFEVADEYTGQVLYVVNIADPSPLNSSHEYGLASREGGEAEIWIVERRLSIPEAETVELSAFASA